MTTIAWDGKTMAADRRYVIGGTPLRAPEPKIRRLTFRGEQAVAGASGDGTHGDMLIAWLAAGAREDQPPSLSDSEEDRCAVILATPSGVWVFANSITGVALGQIKWAAGSGADYALGAMAAGASAKRAVGIAISLDINSGCGVDALRLRST